MRVGHGLVLRGSKVGQEGGHLVKRSSPHCLVVPMQPRRDGFEILIRSMGQKCHRSLEKVCIMMHSSNRETPLQNREVNVDGVKKKY